MHMHLPVSSAEKNSLMPSVGLVSRKSQVLVDVDRARKKSTHFRMLLTRSDGSSEFAWPIGVLGNHCKTICSVNGPLRPQVRDEIPTEALIELVFRPGKGVVCLKDVYIQDTIYSAISSMIAREKLPRLLIQIVVQLLEDGEPKNESVYKMACAINAAALALCKTAIPLTGLVVALPFAIVNGKVIVQPDLAQMQSASSLHCVAFHTSFRDDGSVNSKLAMLQSEGEFNAEDLAVLYEVAEAASFDLYKRQRERISQNSELIWKPK